MARERGIPVTADTHKRELIFKLLSIQAGKGGPIPYEGVLQPLPDGYGFLHSREYNYLDGPDDAYVAPSQIRRFDLRLGDTVSGQVRPPKEGERYFVLIKVDAINSEPPGEARNKISFAHLTPVFPNERLKLETKKDDFSGRVMDLFAPIGLGQRALIVGPHSTGKTTLLRSIAHSIATNRPDLVPTIVKIDARPEEVTHLRLNLNCEVISSTHDEPPSRHLQLCEIVVERARRSVEQGHHAVVLLDSITRLAQACGEDSNALLGVRRLFEAAHKMQEGGSLTIVATAAPDAGSQVNGVILEELRSAANMEVHLDRRLADKAVFPAIDIGKTGTRNNELLLSHDERVRIRILRNLLDPLSAVESMELILDKLGKTPSNAAFLKTISG